MKEAKSQESLILLLRPYSCSLERPSPPLSVDSTKRFVLGAVDFKPGVTNYLFERTFSSAAWLDLTNIVNLLVPIGPLLLPLLMPCYYSY